jgi:predicted MPP superfamily phosphohydrolase
VLTANDLGRRFVSGRWHHEGMHGFTSRGAGTSGLPVRFFSRGEVTLITLRRAR